MTKSLNLSFLVLSLRCFPISTVLVMFCSVWKAWAPPAPWFQSANKWRNARECRVSHVAGCLSGELRKGDNQTKVGRSKRDSQASVEERRMDSSFRWGKERWQLSFRWAERTGTIKLFSWGKEKEQPPSGEGRKREIKYQMREGKGTIKLQVREVQSSFRWGKEKGQ